MQVHMYVHACIPAGTYTHMNTLMHTLTIGHKVHHQHSTILQKVVSISTHRPDTSSVGHTLSDVSDHYSCVGWISGVHRKDHRGGSTTAGGGYVYIQLGSVSTLRVKGHSQNSSC